MKLISLHDKRSIEAFLRKDVFLHIYSLGDLDDFFWSYTTWYGSQVGEHLQAVAMLYHGLKPPVLQALTVQENLEKLRGLLKSLFPLLPSRFYAHITLGLEEVLETDYNLASHGLHYKMALIDQAKLQDINTSHVVPISQMDLPDLEYLYEASYPGNAFDPRMLETGQFFAIRDGDQLISVAGVHVFSQKYRVAALGNIATHPDHRSKGYAKAVISKLCLSLLKSVRNIQIGLNVKIDNKSAIHTYKQLGFEITHTYHELMVIKKA